MKANGERGGGGRGDAWGASTGGAVRYFRAVREKKVPVLTMLELRRYNCTSNVPPSVGTCEIRALASSVLCVHTCAGEEALTDQDHTGVGNDP